MWLSKRSLPISHSLMTALPIFTGRCVRRIGSTPRGCSSFQLYIMEMMHISLSVCESLRLMLRWFLRSLESFSLTSASGFRKINGNLELEESNDYHIDD